MKKYTRFLAPVLIAAIFVLAVYLLYDKLKAYSLAQIRAAIDQIPPARLWLSLLLAVVNYFILVGYDWLALKAIGKSLPLGRVGLVSFVGQAVSYNFGALLGGTSVRFRFYSVWGFSIHEVVHLILMLAVTFWIGALGLSGFVFIIAPPVFPPELMAKMPIKDVRVLGYILSAIAVAYLVLCFTVRKPVRVFGKEFVFPSPRIAVAQVVVSWIDLIAAAACMWVLLPSHIGIGFLDFLPGYLMAQVAVVLTHIPGGVGVFELVIIHLTHTPHEQVVFAAVLMFRLIYYILPLLAAALVLLIYEVRQRRNFLRDAGRWVSVLSPTISAYLSLAAGAILLLFSSLPPAKASMQAVARFLPVEACYLGTALCALAGCVLVFLPYGLIRRQLRSWRLAMGCLALGVAGTFLRGSWLPALVALVVLGTLWAASRRFCRRSFFAEEPIPFPWIMGAVGIVAANFALGWALFHTAWGGSALLSLDCPANAAVARAIDLAIAVLLCLMWPARLWLRRRAEARRRAQDKSRPQAGRA